LAANKPREGARNFVRYMRPLSRHYPGMEAQHFPKAHRHGAEQGVVPFGLPTSPDPAYL
jgi:hypothetical protein